MRGWRIWVSRLTLEEKIALIHGNSKFTVAGIPRLAVPLRWLSDGPLGVREDVSSCVKHFALNNQETDRNTTVSIPLTPRGFAWYNPATRSWQVDKASFQFLAGSSSRDLPLRQPFAVNQTIGIP